MKKRKTVQDIIGMKENGEKITMLTAYDASMAALMSGCGVDILLVGDSLGMVILGYDSTVPVTMDEMIHHSAAVRRGAPESFIIGDMPFGSYHADTRDTVMNANRFLKEAGCDAVKLEGGLEMCGMVKALVRSGVPVMGHIGLTPQTASQLGGYKVQGRDDESAIRLLEEAKALTEAGVFGIVLECIPDVLARILSSTVKVPTIGIGAGVHCDGQVLVTHDLLGMFEKFIPSFVKTYTNLAPLIKDNIRQYVQEVRDSKFPEEKHSFTTSSDLEQLLQKK